MKKLLIESWDELVSRIPSIQFKEDEPLEATNRKQEYTWETHESLIAGEWMEGDLKEDECIKDRIVNEDEKEFFSTSTPTGWFGSYYIGPTSDEVMKAMPTPVHAADYIAQQHDLEYQELGLNGISGTLDPRSSEADNRLIARCNELIDCYEKGVKIYHEYPITHEAYCAALYMREYFIVEESLSEFFYRSQARETDTSEKN